MSLLSINFQHFLWFPRYHPDKILKVGGTTAKSKVTSHHDAAHQHASTNVLIKCQLLTIYGFRYSLDKILKVTGTTSRSKVKSGSHHDAAHLHTLTMALLNVKFLQLMVFDIVWTRYKRSGAILQS